MSFYHDLLRFTKEGCPVVCIYSDLIVDAYIDIPIEDSMKLFQMGKGYEWDEKNGLRDFESKEVIQDIHADVIRECLRLFRAAPNDNPYHFLVIKSSNFSLNSEYYQRPLLDTAKEITTMKKAADEKADKEIAAIQKAAEKNGADENNSAKIAAIRKAAYKSRKMIFIICTSKQLPSKKLLKNPKDKLNKFIKYLKLDEAARFEIRKRLVGVDLLTECPECSEQIRAFKEKAGFDDTNDEIAFIQSLQEMVKTSEIYESICRDLKVDEQYEDESAKKEQRNRSKPQLRDRLSHFLENVTHSDLSPFVDNNGKIVRIPKSEAPIIQMLISASKTSTGEDWLIENWVMGKYENPKEEEFGEIYVLYQILEKRINELYSKDEIDSLTKDRWISYLKTKLNYDSISAIMYFKADVKTLIQASKPLISLGNDDEVSQVSSRMCYTEKELQIAQTIEKEIAPFLVTQKDYLSFAALILRTLKESAIKKSEKMLEYAYTQSKSEEPKPIEPNFSSYPGITVLGAPLTWEEFLTASLTNNQSLKPALWNNPILQDTISDISDIDLAEIEANYKFGKHGKLIPKTKKEKQNPPQE